VGKVGRLAVATATRVAIYARALRMLVAVAPRECALMAALLVVQGAASPAGVWIVKAIVDAVAEGGAGAALGLLVALWAAAALVGQLATEWAQLVQGSLNERATAHVELALVRKANQLPDLTPFEDPSFYDELQLLAREATHRPLNLLVTTGIVVPNALATVGLLVLVGRLAWWLPVLLLAAVVPLSFAHTHMQLQSWQTILRHGPLTRALRYFASVPTTAAHAKEVRLFGLGPYFERRYAAAFEQLRRETSQVRARLAPLPLAAGAVFVGANAAGFWWVAEQARSGRLGVGDLVLLLQSLALLRGHMGSIAGMLSVVVGHLLFFEQLFRFLDRGSAMPLARPGARTPRPLREGIRFEDVSFRYPNGALALERVSFAIRPGERVALVGENGAGKSTLAKLLCRLYDPSEGRILVDGDDLRGLDLDGWRARVGAVFQDFGRYQLTLAENVALGQIEAVGDQARIARAGETAGLAPHAAALPAGYATRLGVEMGGVDLSGGQWQTVGVARALLRDADLLILDEPTAALDPRAEAALFARFAELSRGRTTLLITHRLASVRLADRILVLDAGRLVEEGAHDDLLRRGGEYAALYRMQAEQYQPLAT
jgi:ATP-binding cassette subfamily B protein